MAVAATPPSDHAKYISLLYYRTDSRGRLEIFVRWNPDEMPLTHTIPSGSAEGFEDLEACGKICAQALLELDPARIEFKPFSHGDVTNVGRKIWVRIFLLEAGPELEVITRLEDFHGWKHAFLLLSSLETLSICDNVDVSRAALQEFFKTTAPTTPVEPEPWYRQGVFRKMSKHSRAQMPDKGPECL
ncbi:hypothetical protein GGR57DRAFT_504131 [Xylariaceae sp. FL1272]|nr:hypothetical protein GGR57DRAFT_504131 [Xylariaceae sp. FL1272]